MLNIVNEPYSCTPFYTEIYNINEFNELEKLNLNPISVRIIIESYSKEDDIINAKRIFDTNEFRIIAKKCVNDYNDLKIKINKLYNQNIKVCLSVVYKKYKDNKNLQVILFPQVNN